MPGLFAYRDAKGREPFNEWFQDLDARAAAKVRSALAQLEAANMSEVKPVGGGVSERRIHWRKGLRIYFGQDGETIVILLGGGTKATQRRDIDRAAQCWADYKQRRNKEKK
jgi:putative addiction module killer protein